MSTETPAVPTAGGSLADRVTNPADTPQTTGTKQRPYRRPSTLPRRGNPHILPGFATCSSTNSPCSFG